ncbi:MAG: succinate dehydrogenase [Propionibacteriales bacterium]|nr:MAG: succinate dehydrogenase [Propionibacteriales bacterium]
MKALMALTGLALVGFLLMHMFGNLKLLMGPEAFDHYAHYLREFLYPLLPKQTFLWLFRLFLLFCIVAHIWSAAKLSRRKARSVGNVAGTGRYQSSKQMEKSYASRTMLWGGIIIFLFIIFHLLQFTITPEAITGVNPHEEGPYVMVMSAFSHWWMVLLYLISMAAVCMHLWHGFWSAFATLGANVSGQAQVVIKACAHVVAAVVFIGFMVPPVLILVGVVN